MSKRTREAAGANCAECGEPRPKRTLDEDGVCTMCRMPTTRTPQSPMSTAQHADPGTEVRRG